MEHGVHKFFTGMEESLSKITRPSWLGGGSGPSKQAPAPPVVHSKQEHPTPTPSGEDDSTMRHHCAALERLVEMGLSPQAAKVAVRHLDSWLVSEDGRSEMAVAEAEATSTGEAILHVHDQVRLEGLVKNKGTNGMMGTLEAYGAESHRWKVRLTDDQVFWIKPKLLRPLKMQRMPLPLPDPSPPEHTTGEDEQVCSTSLAHAWAKFEAKQRAWKEEQEDREIRLLEKEEELRKKEEALETLEDEVQFERRRSLGGEATAEPVEFRMADEASLRPRRSSTNSDQELDPELSRVHPATLSRVSDETSVVPLPDDHEEDEEVEADEMWDLDWTAVSRRTATGASAAALPNHEAQGKGYPDSERLLQHKLEEEMG